MANTNKRQLLRLRRRKHVRKNILGTSERPRLSVFRSNTHIYVQAIDDVGMGKSAITLTTASSVESSIRAGSDEGNKKDIAAKVGQLIAERCKEKGISEVVFDRNGFVYHGRVKALADGAREGGLKF